MIRVGTATEASLSKTTPPNVSCGFTRLASVCRLADVIWSMNATEYWDLLVTQRGWTPQQYQGWILDVWTRLILAA